MDTVEPTALTGGSVRLRMALAGVCGSDVATYHWLGHRHRLQAHLPFILGHEGVGRVVEVAPDVETIAVGARVVPEPVIACLRCRLCDANRRNLCLNARRLGSSLPGTMAEEIVVPAASCHFVPDIIDDAQAALLEVFAVAVHSVRRSAGNVAGARCAVIGPGAVGLALAVVLQAFGAAEVLLIGRSRNAERLEVGEALGHVRVAAIDSATSVPAGIADAFDVVFEAGGSPAALELSAEVVRTGGTVVALGGYPGSVTLDYAGRMRSREVDLLASRARVPADWEVLFAQVRAGLVDLDALPATTFALGDAVRAFQIAAEGSQIKVLIDCRN